MVCHISNKDDDDDDDDGDDDSTGNVFCRICFLLQFFHRNAGVRLYRKIVHVKYRLKHCRYSQCAPQCPDNKISFIEIRQRPCNRFKLDTSSSSIKLISSNSGKWFVTKSVIYQRPYAVKLSQFDCDLIVLYSNRQMQQ